jgi:hypothetical protein
MMKGSCYCGEVSFEADAPIRRMINCHCGLCRRLSGAAFTTWVSVRKECFRLLQSAAMKSFSPTENGTRYFCGYCGTHVFSEDFRNPGIVGIPAGVIDDFGAATLDGHYFVGDKVPWHAIGDEAPRFGGESGFEKLK